MKHTFDITLRAIIIFSHDAVENFVWSKVAPKRLHRDLKRAVTIDRVITIGLIPNESAVQHAPIDRKGLFTNQSDTAV